VGDATKRAGGGAVGGAVGGGWYTWLVSGAELQQLRAQLESMKVRYALLVQKPWAAHAAHDACESLPHATGLALGTATNGDNPTPSAGLAAGDVITGARGARTGTAVGVAVDTDASGSRCDDVADIFITCAHS
jgi:hypothetical protein